MMRCMHAVTGGRNGYGAKLANIFSTSFTVETLDVEHGLLYRQQFRNNMRERDAPVVKADSRKKGFTCITFTPDLARFGMTCLDDDIVALMTKRVYDVAGVTNKTLKVFLNDVPIPIAAFKDYVGLYFDSGAVGELGSSEEVVPASKPGGPGVVYCRINDRWEIAVGHNDSSKFMHVSFVNGICTSNGGQHVEYIADQLTRFIVAKANKAFRRDKGGMDIKPAQVRSHLSLFVNCLIENPAFDSQTKETLTTRAAAFGSTALVPEGVLKKVSDCGVLDSVLLWAKVKESSALAKKSGTKRATVLGIPKLDDANCAGTAKSDKCTLILTEGDSAKALAISGLSVVGRDYFGVFPLRGKLLNVRGCSLSEVMDNAEIKSLVDILGLKFGTEYTTTKTLRYGHVMIMADQDHDGSHIKGLVMNFLHAFWPSLVRLPGFLCCFITPIVKCTKGPSTRAFYTMPQYLEWTRDPAVGKGWSVKYYKGLGTSSSVEAKQYFSAIGEHRVAFAHEGPRSDDSLSLAFDHARADDRKAWLQSLEDGTCVDYSRRVLSFSEFVDKELVLFSQADNVRSIASVVDGLKPSQRKILFASFKRNLKAEIKVAQLAGYVAEHSMYHHAEQSLNSTIVGMAQCIIGTNNVNLLYPSGQFGTRLMGGKDAASPRYIYTRLSCITRTIFHADDDPLLEYLVEDGVPIEPKTYVPVVPMVLVNGCEGIGTGWSTSVPTFHPLEIVEALRARIAAARGVPFVAPATLTPWFRGFSGTVVAKGASLQVSTVGKFSLSEAQRMLDITELPIGSWTQDYKQFLDTLRADGGGAGKKKAAAPKPEAAVEDNKKKKKHAAGAGGIIESFTEENTDTRVLFHVKVCEGAMADLSTPADVVKKFKLETSMKLSNMHLFNVEGKIEKYPSAEAIMDVFMPVRLALYERRKARLLEDFDKKLAALSNKTRFIMMVRVAAFASHLHLHLRRICVCICVCICPCRWWTER